jgi:hypothetical protein
MTRSLPERHDDLVAEITEEREEELSALQEDQEEAANRRAKRDPRESLHRAGIDVDDLEDLETQRAREQREEIADIEQRMEEQSREAETAGLNVDASFLPEGAQTLTPVWVAGFSNDDRDEEYRSMVEMDEDSSTISATTLQAQTVLSGGACKDYYNWASGGGWGCTDGVGRNQSWVEFGFWYKPEVSRFYSIVPHYRYRGFYIVKADDEWYNCKNARVRVSQWVNVHQYGNWKGWTDETVNNVGGGDIDVNKRYDDDKHMYSSYLLGGGDWAFVRCVIGLYARAQGGGSYAKNDFSTGSANYLCVPHCHVY